MNRAGCLTVVVLLFMTIARGQKYIVRFTDKNNSAFTISDPSGFLSNRAIDRRNRYHIPVDSSDLPVSTAYLDSLKSIQGITLLNASKWLNQVSIQVTNPAALTRIALFPFVRSTTPLTFRAASTANSNRASVGKAVMKRKYTRLKRKTDGSTNFFNYGDAFNQIHLHNGEFLHNIGLRGQNMIIGMLDAGYLKYNTLMAFDSVNTNRQVLGTWDFVANNATVSDDDAHGMECFSIIAGNVPGSFVGTAPKASFYLFRSENSSSEYPIEEHDWVCAAEKVDSAGGDVISSSLGYSKFDKQQYNHTYNDMDGNTTMAAKGADLAAQKGIIVVNAAGNEGASSWKYISTPADGDSVLAVGSVNANGQPAASSGYGPSADGQTKPDVAAMGVAAWVQLPNNNFGTGNGTSFACPAMAGLATCLWQGFPELNNMSIVNALRSAGNISSNPNNRIGYGIPDVRSAMGYLLKQIATVSASLNNCRTTIKWTSKDVSEMKYEIERKTSSESEFRKIAAIEGTGNEFMMHNYEFTDLLSNVNEGPLSYRIRQIIDSTSENIISVYLDTVSINVQPSCSLTGKVNIFPNPTSGKLSIQTAFEEAVNDLQVVTYNMSGQTVAKMHYEKPRGTYNFVLEMPKLASGKYFISIYNGKNLIETRELLIVK